MRRDNIAHRLLVVRSDKSRRVKSVRVLFIVADRRPQTSICVSFFTDIIRATRDTNDLAFA